MFKIKDHDQFMCRLRSARDIGIWATIGTTIAIASVMLLDGDRAHVLAQSSSFGLQNAASICHNPKQPLPALQAVSVSYSGKKVRGTVRVLGASCHDDQNHMTKGGIIWLQVTTPDNLILSKAPASMYVGNLSQPKPNKPVPAPVGSLQSAWEAALKN